MQKNIYVSLSNLIAWVEKEEYKGYDPYDGLNSSLFESVSNKYLRIAAIQFNKFCPLNARPLLEIKKNYSPKGMALFLQAFSLLAKNNNLGSLNKSIYDGIDIAFTWIKENMIEMGEGICWAVNFPLTSFGADRPRHDPSSVLACFMGEALYEYYLYSEDLQALSMMKKIAIFIEENIPITETGYGICYSYTTSKKDIVFNATMHVAEFYAKLYSLTNDKYYKARARKCVDFCLYHQKSDGRWAYSISENGKERNQYDFHQAFILCSLFDYMNLCEDDRPELIKSISIGLDFYNQYLTYGPKTMWRYPLKYPIDIHNQAMSIICHSKLSSLFPASKGRAMATLSWTIDNMQDKRGFFYTHKYPIIVNKTPHIRWGQAWMSLAFANTINMKGE